MTYRLMELRDPLIEIVNRYWLPDDVWIRVAQVTDLRKPASIDGITVELFTTLTEPPVIPPDVVEFHDEHMDELRTQILDLLRPYAPFQGLRLTIRRDAEGLVWIDGSEGRP